MRAWPVPAWPVPAVSETALRELRRRWDPALFQALFEVLAGPLAQPRAPGVCFAGMGTLAFDGINSLKIPDTDRNPLRDRPDLVPAGLGRLPEALVDVPG